MEFESFTPKMRNPLPGFCGLFLPISPLSNPSINFVKAPQKRPRLLLGSNLSYSSYCVHGIVETDPTSVVASNGFEMPIFSVVERSVQFKKGRQKKYRASLGSSPSHLLSSSAVRIVEKDPKSTFQGVPISLGKQGYVNSDCNETLRRYSEMLGSCTKNGSLNDGMAIHGQVIKNGVVPDSHLWNCLVNLYAKCASSRCAYQVLMEMPGPDVVSWTAMIAGCVAEGDGSKAVGLFCEMRGEGIRPNGFTFATGLRASSMCLALDFGKQMHGEVIKLGMLSDIFVGSALVDLYAKCSAMELAERVFSCMPEQNAVSWNALLNGYARMGDGEEVLELFQKMTQSEIRLSKFTLSTVFKGCASSGNAREGKAVHSLTIKIGCELDDFLSSSIVDMYSKCGLAADAYKIFVRIKNPDVVAWSTMISCLNQQGHNCKAAELFGEMGQIGVRPNEFTLASLISAASDIGDPRYGDSIHAWIWKLGFEFDNSVSNALVTMYMKFGSVHDGWKVFKAMTDRDPVSWNALLSGFHDGNSCDQGPEIFNQMLIEGFKPNKYTFISILRSCSSLTSVGLGQQVHAHVIKNSLDSDGFVGTALVDMYAKCGCLENANVVFNRMKERDLFSWTVIVAGYAQSNQGENALKCFNQMQREGVCPNEFTLASYLRGCSSIAALENGRQLHSRIIKSGYSDDIFVASALIDMYGKSGYIEDAESIFNGLVSRDIVSWNTIICGYSQHGHGEKALKAFWSMLDEGIMPDEVTFIGVLSACSYMGLIEEGRRQFDSLYKVYGITPSIGHHACMVDILGRAGKLDEVKSFIEKMTITPNALIWQTVLGACRMHRNVEFGEIAAEKLFELEPEMDSTYILLSNIYAAKGRWDDVSRIRALMSSRGVKKEPGCSWVEFDGQVHVFLPQDSSHPMVKEIYLKLEELGQKLTSAGYTPNTENVLHNVAEREKKESLLYHSERLALAFSLISMKHEKPIRIFKNLRICRDCHNAIKLISDITNREIIIRDVNRFHHFKSGACSCRDYW